MAKISFTNYGLPSDLAEKLNSAKASIDVCKAIDKKNLQAKYALSNQEAEIVKQFLKRKPIPPDILQKVLTKNNYVCCVCRGAKGDSYIIHHINSRPSDNKLSNLAVLCPNDHDLAHKTGIMVTRKLSAQEVKHAKKEWENFVFSQRAQIALRPRNKKEWKIKADKIANYIKDHLFEAHRGSILYDSSTSVVFGNDGYVNDKNDGRVKMEVTNLRRTLRKNKIKILGFGLCDDKFTWCMIVDSEKIKFLNSAVWSAWPDGTVSTQQSIAYLATWTYQTIGLCKYF